MSLQGKLALISGTVKGIRPGSAGGSWSRWTGSGAWLWARSRSSAAVTAEAVRPAQPNTVCHAIAE